MSSTDKKSALEASGSSAQRAQVLAAQGSVMGPTFDQANKVSTNKEASGSSLPSDVPYAPELFRVKRMFEYEAVQLVVDTPGQHGLQSAWDKLGHMKFQTQIRTQARGIIRDNPPDPELDPRERIDMTGIKSKAVWQLVLAPEDQEAQDEVNAVIREAMIREGHLRDPSAPTASP